MHTYVYCLFSLGAFALLPTSVSMYDKESWIRAQDLASKGKTRSLPLCCPPPPAYPGYDLLRAYLGNAWSADPVLPICKSHVS